MALLAMPIAVGAIAYKLCCDLAEEQPLDAVTALEQPEPSP
jgi:hypothetical protein